MTTGFFIGRFQPLHNGHLKVIKKALDEVNLLIIAIGSTEKSYLKDNPFTTGERVEMIKRTLDNEGIDAGKYLIIPIRDINNYSTWVSHVEMYCPKFTVVYTGSPITKMLFENKGNGYVVKYVKKVEGISSSIVREKMLKRENWQELIPEKVVEFLNGIDSEKRIKDIAVKD